MLIFYLLLFFLIVVGVIFVACASIFTRKECQWIRRLPQQAVNDFQTAFKILNNEYTSFQPIFAEGFLEPVAHHGVIAGNKWIVFTGTNRKVEHVQNIKTAPVITAAGRFHSGWYVLYQKIHFPLFAAGSPIYVAGFSRGCPLAAFFCYQYGQDFSLHLYQWGVPLYGDLMFHESVNSRCKSVYVIRKDGDPVRYGPATLWATHNYQKEYQLNSGGKHSIESYSYCMSE